MLRMGLFLAAILVPVQIFFGHLTGDYVHDYQPAKFAAIEARWHDEQPASEVLIALPGSGFGDEPIRDLDSDSRQPDRQHELRLQGGRSDRLSAGRPAAGRHSVFHVPDHGRLRPRHAAARLGGTYLSLKGRLEQNRLLLWAIFLSFPLPFIATLTGWFTAEVGRQPWDGLRRAADRRGRDAVSDGARGDDLARRLLRRLQLHLRLRCSLHLSLAAQQVRTGGWPGRPSPQAPTGRCRSSTAPSRRTRSNWLPENSHDHVLGPRPGAQHVALCAARRIRSRRRHSLRADRQRDKASGHVEPPSRRSGTATRPGSS